MTPLSHKNEQANTGGRWSLSRYLPLFILMLTSMAAGAVSAQVDAAREFRSDLFPPDLILREAEALGLTDQQRDAVARLVKETKRAFVEGQPKLRATSEILAQSLKSPTVTEQTALDQFGAILEAEEEFKRAQFLMLLRAKNLLTPSQQEKLRAIVESQPSKSSGKMAATSPTESAPTNAREELNARLQKVQAGVDRWRREGRDPAPILELIKTFGDQMQANQLPAAKETLQRALDRLNAPEHR